MQMKKVLAGTLAALTAGATLAMGAIAIDSLGDYVTTSDGTLTSPIIVIGQGGLPGFAKDVVGAADIAAAVAGYATTPVSSTGETTSVSGGTDVATTDNKLYFTSQLDKAKSTLTSNDLPTILAAGTASVDATGTFTFNQYINIGSRSLPLTRAVGILTTLFFTSIQALQLALARCTTPQLRSTSRLTSLIQTLRVER